MTPCRICDSKSQTKLFTKHNLEIVKCDVCGLQYTAASPGMDQMKALYCEGYFKSGGKGTSYFDYLSEEGAMALNAKARLAGIEQFKSSDRTKRLLDVGCATGFFLKAAASKWNSSGLELSQFASSYARDTTGLPVKTGTLEEASYPEGYFDIVTLWDVIEHLPYPLRDLHEIHRIMKSGGLLVLTTGDAGSMFARICGRWWHLYNPAQHLSYFSRPTIELLLNKAGFKIIKIKNDGSYFTVSYLTSCLAMYYPSLLTKALHGAISRTPLESAKIYVNLRDIMTVYAAKT